MPGQALPQVVKIIHSLKESVLTVKVHRKKGEANQMTSEFISEAKKPGRRGSLKGLWKGSRIDDSLFLEAKKTLSLMNPVDVHMNCITDTHSLVWYFTSKPGTAALLKICPQRQITECLRTRLFEPCYSQLFSCHIICGHGKIKQLEGGGFMTAISIKENLIAQTVYEDKPKR